MENLTMETIQRCAVEELALLVRNNEMAFLETLCRDEDGGLARFTYRLKTILLDEECPSPLFATVAFQTFILNCVSVYKRTYNF